MTSVAKSAPRHQRFGYRINAVGVAGALVVGFWIVVALVATWALVLWSGISVGWADDRGAAWLGTERWGLYALAFSLPVLFPPTRAALDRMVALVPVLGLVGLAVGLGHAIVAAGSLQEGRLSSPTGYPNATGTLLVSGRVPL